MITACSSSSSHPTSLGGYVHNSALQHTHNGVFCVFVDSFIHTSIILKHTMKHTHTQAGPTVLGSRMQT